MHRFAAAVADASQKYLRTRQIRPGHRRIVMGTLDPPRVVVIPRRTAATLRPLCRFCRFDSVRMKLNGAVAPSEGAGVRSLPMLLADSANDPLDEQTRPSFFRGQRGLDELPSMPRRVDLRCGPRTISHGSSRDPGTRRPSTRKARCGACPIDRCLACDLEKQVHCSFFYTPFLGFWRLVFDKQVIYSFTHQYRTRDPRTCSKLIQVIELAGV